MTERTEEQILDQVIHAIQCVCGHYGPYLNEDGLFELRTLLKDFTNWHTDSSYLCDVNEDDPYVDFNSRIIHPWK